ncbi:hypothetical protein V6N11_052562 [Hibiscus sabdariffa]|uniref:Uncharacterized protein n=1 Tax=Hibiscus sabdariffa TaxID=183260 RepID=A0ABR2UAD9_9ROSI
MWDSSIPFPTLTLRKQLAIQNNKAIAGELNLFDLENTVSGREFGITVEDSSQTITTFEDAAYLIQKLCSEESVRKNIH